MSSSSSTATEVPYCPSLTTMASFHNPLARLPSPPPPAMPPPSTRARPLSPIHHHHSPPSSMEYYFAHRPDSNAINNSRSRKRTREGRIPGDHRGERYSGSSGRGVGTSRIQIPNSMSTSSLASNTSSPTSARDNPSPSPSTERSRPRPRQDLDVPPSLLPPAILTRDRDEEETVNRMRTLATTTTANGSASTSSMSTRASTSQSGLWDDDDDDDDVSMGDGSAGDIGRESQSRNRNRSRRGPLGSEFEYGRGSSSVTSISMSSTSSIPSSQCSNSSSSSPTDYIPLHERFPPDLSTPSSRSTAHLRHTRNATSSATTTTTTTSTPSSLARISSCPTLQQQPQPSTSTVAEPQRRQPPVANQTSASVRTNLKRPESSNRSPPPPLPSHTPCFSPKSQSKCKFELSILFASKPLGPSSSSPTSTSSSSRGGNSNLVEIDSTPTPTSATTAAESMGNPSVTSSSLPASAFTTNQGQHPSSSSAPPGPTPGPSSGGGELSEDIPPAFFPGQRVPFAPKLKVPRRSGLRFSAIGGMQLGVTGVMEILSKKGQVIMTRMVADYTTNLDAGLSIWKRDAALVRQMKIKKGVGGAENDDGDLVAPGTYVLPLQMKLPTQSAKLPVSFESATYRVRYMISLALIASEPTPPKHKNPYLLGIACTPFHVLPSTLPSPPPILSLIEHKHRKDGILPFMKNLIGHSASRPNDWGQHIILPTLPTDRFSPGSQSTVPLNLGIVDEARDPMDLYVRVSLVRRLYFREDPQTSLRDEFQQDWLYGVPESHLLGEEFLLRKYLKEESEVCSRWAWFPSGTIQSTRRGVTKKVKSVDVSLPLSQPLEDGSEAWLHGFSSSVDLLPSPTPFMTHFTCSWFSPILNTRQQSPLEYSRHVHASSRFNIVIETGFVVAGNLEPLLQESAAAIPDMTIPAPGKFTPTMFTESGSNPFPKEPKRSLTTGRIPPVLPTSSRQVAEIPITIGSVSERNLSCLEGRIEFDGPSGGGGMDEHGDPDLSNPSNVHDDTAWTVPPPSFETALATPPYIPP